MTEAQPPDESRPADAERNKRKPLWRRFCRSVVRVGVAAYLGLCVVLTTCQSRMVYQPRSRMDATPKDLGLDYEEVRFRTADEVELFGWYIPAADPRGVVVVCHGNAGNISGRLYTIDTLGELGLDVFIFDYRGYGRSKGKPSEKGAYLDADAAWRYVTETRSIDPGRVVFFGRSLGGAVAAHLASERPVGALIVESTFSSARDVARHYWPFLPVRWLLRCDYATVDYVRSISCPIMVIHSPDDGIIPFRQGRKVFEAAREPKTFLQISGDHNDRPLAGRPAYLRQVGAFLDRALSGMDVTTR